MVSAYKSVDRSAWPRNGHDELFARLEFPFYSITYPVDVTAVADFAHSHKLSFYHSVMWCVMDALNRIEAFRYRLSGDEVRLYDSLSPSYTCLGDGELFGIVDVDWERDMNVFRFCELARAAELRRGDLPTAEEDERGYLVFISCLPWISYTQVTQEATFDRTDSVPRIMWGKYTNENGRKVMPFTIQANHRLIDGIHLKQLDEAMKANILALEENHER